MASPAPRVSESPQKARCTVRVLVQPPYDGARNVGTIHLAGKVSTEAEVIRIVDRKACEIGADAIFVRDIQQLSSGGLIDYNITAAAYALGDGKVPPPPEEQPRTVP